MTRVGGIESAAKMSVFWMAVTAATRLGRQPSEVVQTDELGAD